MKYVESGVVLTSNEIADKTGKQHKNVLRDIRTKLLPAVTDALKSEPIYFIVESTTYLDKYKRSKDNFTLNVNAVHVLMANYSVSHAMGLVVYIRELEQELVKKQEEVDLMKSLVWEVINGQSYISQEQALKMANIKHPRLFMKYLKGNKTFYEDVVFTRHYLKEKQCNAKGDRWWKFTKDGFKWLLENNTKINEWVSLQKSNQKVPC